MTVNWPPRQRRLHAKLAARFPAGQRVRSGGLLAPRTPARGTVEKFVPGGNAQGGILVIRWDTGTVGRHSPGTIERDE